MYIYIYMKCKFELLHFMVNIILFTPPTPNRMNIIYIHRENHQPTVSPPPPPLISFRMASQKGKRNINQENGFHIWNWKALIYIYMHVYVCEYISWTTKSYIPTTKSNNLVFFSSDIPHGLSIHLWLLPSAYVTKKTGRPTMKKRSARCCLLGSQKYSYHNFWSFLYYYRRNLWVWKKKDNKKLWNMSYTNGDQTRDFFALDRECLYRMHDFTIENFNFIFIYLFYVHWVHSYTLKCRVCSIQNN